MTPATDRQQTGNSKRCVVSVRAVIEIPAEGDYDREETDRAELVGIHLSGSRPPFFLIRTWYGEIEHERAIARLLGPEQPIVSVGPLRGKRLEDFPADAQGWADIALARLLGLAGASPRRIGGWSFGGMLAYEVGQRLARRGLPVDLVAMLDTGVPSQRPNRNRQRVHRGSFHRAVRHLDQFLEERTWPKRLAYLRARSERRRRKLEKHAERIRSSWRGAQTQGIRRGLDASDGSYVTQNGERITLLQRTIWVSYRKYRPDPSQFPVLLLRTERTQREAGEPTLGWGHYLNGSLQAAFVPGDHYTMFDEPNVTVVAQWIGTALENADRQS